MKHTLSTSDVARELGRSTDWLKTHWRSLVAAKKLPAPISGADEGPLAWSAAQVYAFLDKGLPQALKPSAAAYRAAMAAATGELHTSGPDTETMVADAVKRLDTRFANGAA